MRGCVEVSTSAKSSLPSAGTCGKARANGSADDDLLDLTAPFAFCVGFRTFPSDFDSDPTLMAKVARGPAVVVFDLALTLGAPLSAGFLGECFEDMSVNSQETKLCV